MIVSEFSDLDAFIAGILPGRQGPAAGVREVRGDRPTRSLPAESHPYLPGVLVERVGTLGFSSPKITRVIPRVRIGFAFLGVLASWREITLPVR